MKRLAIAIIIIISVLLMLPGSTNAESDKDLQRAVAEKIIRFHVVANSNSQEDKLLKAKVKDDVVDYTSELLKNSKSKAESKEILLKADSKIKEIAVKSIKGQGSKYKVKTEMSIQNFPIRQYGNIVFPEGEYEAYTITIGEGKGDNWWCVMFPPICFVDVTLGEVEKQETENMMENNLTPQEFGYLKGEQVQKVNFKSKIGEMVQNLFD